MFIDEIEVLIAGKESPGTAETEAARLPDESQWLLVEVYGDTLIDGTYATLKISGNSYGGYDGCNSFGWVWDDGTLIAEPDGTFSVPVTIRTQRLCGGIDGVMEQADSYVKALREGKAFRVDGDKLEILDEADQVSLVLVRKAPLPGSPVDLGGSAWSMAVEEDESSGRAPTLAFLSDYIAAGITACRAYVAHFRIDDEQIDFPAMSMTGTAKDCAEHLLELEGSYTDQLSFSDDYSVEEASDGRLLRIRTRNGKVLLYKPLKMPDRQIPKGRWVLDIH